MAYTTETKVERYLAVDIGSNLASEVADWIKSVTLWIERYTGKSFEASSADKYYDGNGTNRILVDSFIDGTITELSILDTDGVVENTLTEGQSNDFITYPLNNTEKCELVLVSGGTRSTFPNRVRSVKVTADWGFSASVPKDIELVATKLVGEIIREGLKGGKLERVTLGDYNATFQKIDEKADPLGIYQILDMYRDLTI